LPDAWEQAQFGGLTNATSETDSDNDGLTDGEELAAGSDPLDDTSVFGVESIESGEAPDGFVVRWASATNRLYSVERSTNLTEATPFSPLASQLPATPPMNTYTDSAPQTGQAFYRVETEDQP